MCSVEQLVRSQEQSVHSFTKLFMCGTDAIQNGVYKLPTKVYSITMQLEETILSVTLLQEHSHNFWVPRFILSDYPLPVPGPHIFFIYPNSLFQQQRLGMPESSEQLTFWEGTLHINGEIFVGRILISIFFLKIGVQMTPGLCDVT